MNILILGDTHADFHNLKNWIAYCALKGIHTILQVGDFGYFPRLPEYASFVAETSKYAAEKNVCIYFVHGNHDDLHSLFNDHGRYGDEHLIYLASHVVWVPTGVPFKMGNRNCVAIGGAYSIDQHSRIAGVDWFPEETLNYGDGLKCTSLVNIDVIFSHDCPADVDLNIDLMPGTDSNRYQLQYIVDHLQPRILFHGHYHMSHDTRMNATRVIGLNCNGRPRQAAIFNTMDMTVNILDECDLSGKILKDNL